MKTSLGFTCCLPIPGRNSDEYLNGKLPFVCCFVFIFDGGRLVTVTRRMVSSLVVEDVDDEDEDDDRDEFDSCFFVGLAFFSEFIVGSS